MKFYTCSDIFLICGPDFEKPLDKALCFTVILSFPILYIFSRDIDLKLNLDDEIHGSPSLLKFTASTGSSDCLVVLLRHASPDLSIMVNLIRWISLEKNLSLVLQVGLIIIDSSIAPSILIILF